MTDETTGIGATDASASDTPTDLDLDALAEVAADAVAAGGDYLRDRFADGATDADYSELDVKTVADREAEERVLATIRESYGGHAITAEESGRHDGEGHRWVVDALDGTNNFAAGIPTWGVASTVCNATVPNGSHPDADWMAGDPEPLAAAVAVPVLEDVYVATLDGGVRYNGQSVAVSDGDHRSLTTGTVGMIIGKPVLAGGAERREWDAITDAVEDRCKRGIQTWAPVVYWGLLARGKLDGFVCYYPDEREQAAGELFAREAGAHEQSDGPLTVFGATPEIRNQLWDAAQTGLGEVER